MFNLSFLSFLLFKICETAELTLSILIDNHTLVILQSFSSQHRKLYLHSVLFKECDKKKLGERRHTKITMSMVQSNWEDIRLRRRPTYYKAVMKFKSRPYDHQSQINLVVATLDSTQRKLIYLAP